MPTRIDFHSNVPDKLQYCCRLVRKARARPDTPRILLLNSDAGQLARLDEALWTFSDLDFLPHVTVEHPLAPHTPILLSTREIDPPQGEPLLLINLTTRLVQDPARFVRIIEIVPADEHELLLGRQRYRDYNGMGAQLSHHVATP
ncbi:DNA polymerase III subunit chi [Massilia sp. W12]|uniref:DNA polymerase III subunit chi n=1 Tax=Massilia sp. W12 TaxID=3126507 RepID=UPI0030D33C36